MGPPPRHAHRSDAVGGGPPRPDRAATGAEQALRVDRPRCRGRAPRRGVRRLRPRRAVRRADRRHPGEDAERGARAARDGAHRGRRGRRAAHQAQHRRRHPAGGRLRADPSAVRGGAGQPAEVGGPLASVHREPERRAATAGRQPPAEHRDDDPLDRAALRRRRPRRAPGQAGRRDRGADQPRRDRPGAQPPRPALVRRERPNGLVARGADHRRRHHQPARDERPEDRRDRPAPGPRTDAVEAGPRRVRRVATVRARRVAGDAAV